MICLIATDILKNKNKKFKYLTSRKAKQSFRQFSTEMRDRTNLFWTNMTTVPRRRISTKLLLFLLTVSCFYCQKELLHSSVHFWGKKTNKLSYQEALKCLQFDSTETKKDAILHWLVLSWFGVSFPHNTIWLLDCSFFLKEMSDIGKQSCINRFICPSDRLKTFPLHLCKDPVSW